MTISEGGVRGPMVNPMDQGLRASIHFPIEGRSPWVMVLRAVALGSVSAMLTIAAVMMFVDLGGDITMIVAGISAFLLLEYFIIRGLIVPRVADYGRFRVYENRVDFFPLGMSGLTVSESGDSEPISSFAGLTVKADTERSVYRVMLLHKEQPGRTVCLKVYNAPQPANSHAEALAQTMGIGYAPFKGGAGAVKRAA